MDPGNNNPQLADLLARIVALEAPAAAPGAAPYVSPYNLNLYPPPAHAPFIETLGLPQIPAADSTKELKVLPLTVGDPLDYVDRQIYSTFIKATRCRHKDPRIDFYQGFGMGLDAALKSRLVTWIRSHQTQMTAQLDGQAEMDLLRRFTDFAVSLVCQVRTPMDALAQLKELSQEPQECGEQYLSRGLDLAREAGRLICKSTRFVEAEETVVLETLSYFVKGLTNGDVKTRVEYLLGNFLSHQAPTAPCLKQIFRGAVLAARAAIQAAPPSERTSSNTCGLSWHPMDRDLSASLAIVDDFAAVSGPDPTLFRGESSHYFCGRCQNAGHMAYYCRANQTVSGQKIVLSPDEWISGYKSFMSNHEQSRRARGLPVRARPQFGWQSGRGRGGPRGGFRGGFRGAGVQRGGAGGGGRGGQQSGSFQQRSHPPGVAALDPAPEQSDRQAPDASESVF